MTPRFPSGVGHGAMRARLESPRACYATPGFRIGTTRASRRRQLPTKRCHAALLCGATRAYQPDSSSKPLHRQPLAGVLGNSSTFARALRGHQHRPRDRGRRYNPLDSWTFHISRTLGPPRKGAIIGPLFRRRSIRMKLVRFSTQGQSPRLGVLQGDRIADLQASLAATLTRRGVVRAAELAAALVPNSTRAFLEGGPLVEETVAGIKEWV